MKVLVTGGAGFIGSHVVRELLSRGEEAVVLDSLVGGTRENLPAGVRLVRLDVRSEAAREFMEQGHFDAIIHLAAQTMVPESFRSPHFDADENILGTVNVLEAARHGGVRRVVMASSAAVYGDAPLSMLPLKEETPCAPLSFYGISKYTGEKYLELYAKSYGLPTTVLRFANVYGERQGRGGEGGVISIFCRRVAAGLPLTIFGDGEQTRDFVYAGDVARAACQAIKSRSLFGVYNVATSEETSLNDLVRLLSMASGRELKPAHEAARTGDILRSALSGERAREELGFVPQTSLADGLRRTYAYFLEEARRTMSLELSRRDLDAACERWGRGA